jgi:protocatechuate 3,4-dioxygenase beta subunit
MIAKDGIYRRMRDKKARDSVTMALNPLKGSATGDVTARADLVVGVTPED